MRHLQDYKNYNASLKGCLVEEDKFNKVSISPSKEVNRIDENKIETVKGKDIEVKFKQITSVLFSHSFVGLYDISHSKNIQDVVLFNSGDKINRKKGESPKTKIISDINTIKLIVKTEIKNKEYPYSINLIDKSKEHQQGWGMNTDYPKFYLIPFIFEEDESRDEKFVFSEIIISNLKSGRYTFMINGNKIKFIVE
jgi:hypothetical protein